MEGRIGHEMIVLMEDTVHEKFNVPDGLGFVGAIAGANVTGVSTIGDPVAGADVTGVSTIGKDSAGADVTGASLAGADVTGISIAGADVTADDSVGADVMGVFFFVGADRRESSSSSTRDDVAGANVSVAVLSVAVAGAFVGDTAKGLDDVGCNVGGAVTELLLLLLLLLPVPHSHAGIRGAMRGH
jgi:hypothetical protein